MTAAHEKLQSMTAKTTTMQDMDYGEGNSTKSTSMGSYEWLRKGDTVLVRMEMSATMTQSFGGQTQEVKSTSTMINDGKFMYTMSDNDGQKSAMKMKAPEVSAGGIREGFQACGRTSRSKVLPEETVAGHDCVVVEAVAKQTEGNPMVKQLNYFAKDLGMAIKTVGYDKDGKVTFTSETTDIKVGADVSPDRFVFQAPPGVEVMDMSGQ